LTQGFNPRFKISFGPALPLGIAGRNEVLDISLIQEMDNDLIKEKINKFAPEGLEVQDIIAISKEENNLSKAINHAIYIIELNVSGYRSYLTRENLRNCFKNSIEKYLEQENIVIQKNTKKGLREVNLRPYIENMDIVSFQDDTVLIELTVDIQYKGSINPVLIINEFIKKPENKDIYINNIARKEFL
jgi:radical SAM-linked protein